MTNLENLIFQTLTTEYWKPAFSPSRMATAVETATGQSNGDLPALERIIWRHLKEPDFTAMAREIARALNAGFTVNGVQFELGEIAYGEHRGKWVWSTAEDESEPFDTAAEAQGDAMRYARERGAAERDYAQSDEYHRGLQIEDKLNERLGK